ncbi:MAG: hypothetical protein K0R46_3492, partial [Herbinix sp.]|nr:hypothetical protein [Herbinix sp.]
TRKINYFIGLSGTLDIIKVCIYNRCVVHNYLRKEGSNDQFEI